MKCRHMKSALALLSLISLPALALVNPVPTRLQPGLWQFHYRSTTEMEGHAIPAIDHSAQQCIKDTDPAKLPLMPKLPANIKCTAPTLRTSAEGYHVTMACTASEPNGMVTPMDEVFMIAPSHNGSQITIDGTVHQRITGSPVPIPPVLVKISATGHRIGTCLAAKH